MIGLEKGSNGNLQTGLIAYSTAPVRVICGNDMNSETIQPFEESVVLYCWDEDRARY